MASAKVIGRPLEVMIEGCKLAKMDFLSLSDPFAVFEEEIRDGQWKEIGRTETIWDVLDPKFIRSFVLPSETRQNQYFRVRLFDRDRETQSLTKQDFIGSAVCTARDIIDAGTDGKCMELEALRSSRRHRGSVVLIGEPFIEEHPTHELFIDCEVDYMPARNSKSPFGTRPYVSFYRRRANDAWTPIFRSKGVDKNEAHASKNLVQRARIQSASIRGSCNDIPIRVELMSHKTNAEHKLLGSTHFSLGALKRLRPGDHLPLGLIEDSLVQLVITEASIDSASSRFKFEVRLKND